MPKKDGKQGDMSQKAYRGNREHERKKKLFQLQTLLLIKRVVECSVKINLKIKVVIFGLPNVPSKI